MFISANLGPSCAKEMNGPWAVLHEQIKDATVTGEERIDMTEDASMPADALTSKPQRNSRRFLPDPMGPLLNPIQSLVLVRTMAVLLLTYPYKHRVDICIRSAPTKNPGLH
jgi:hypothetical protein